MEHPSSRRLNVFLAEDDGVQLTVLRHVVEKIAGFHLCGVARDGKDAVEQLRKLEGDEQPDVVLCDVNMPIMDGFDVLAAAQQDERLKNIPFVMLTTSTDEEDVQRAYVYGAKSYMSKAFSVTSLAETLQRFTDYWLVAKYRPESITEFMDEVEVEIGDAIKVSDSERMLRIINVYLIEDDPVQVKLFESVLADLRMLKHVGTAESAEAALDELPRLAKSANRPNVIVCDFMLPGRSGIDLLRDLRKNDNYKFTPIVMLTADRDEEVLRQAYEVGANTFINKPVQADELVATIRMLGRFWTDQGVHVPWK